MFCDYGQIWASSDCHVTVIWLLCAKVMWPYYETAMHPMWLICNYYVTDMWLTRDRMWRYTTVCSTSWRMTRNPCVSTSVSTRLSLTRYMKEHANFTVAKLGWPRLSPTVTRSVCCLWMCVCSQVCQFWTPVSGIRSQALPLHNFYCCCAGGEPGNEARHSVGLEDLVCNYGPSCPRLVGKVVDWLVCSNYVQAGESWWCQTHTI